MAGRTRPVDAGAQGGRSVIDLLRYGTTANAEPNEIWIPGVGDRTDAPEIGLEATGAACCDPPLGVVVDL